MQRGEYRGRRFLAPGSLELLSYPLPSYLLTSASQQQLAAGAPVSSATAAEAAQRQRQRQRQQYGIRLRVAGSGWTPPLALDPGELAAGAAAAGGGTGQGQAPQVGVRLRGAVSGNGGTVVEEMPAACALAMPALPRLVRSNASPRCMLFHQMLQRTPLFPLLLIQQAEGLASGRGPVLIRAHASRDGAVHEVVMRLEVTEYGTSQVGAEWAVWSGCRIALLRRAEHAAWSADLALPGAPRDSPNFTPASLPPAARLQMLRLERHIVKFTSFQRLFPPASHLQMLRLEPHIVVSNRTPVPLQLLQTRLALASPPPLVTAASGRGQQPRPQGAVVAEGGHSFSNVASSGFFTSPLWTGGEFMADLGRVPAVRMAAYTCLRCAM